MSRHVNSSWRTEVAPWDTLTQHNALMRTDPLNGVSTPVLAKVDVGFFLLHLFSYCMC